MPDATSPIPEGEAMTGAFGSSGLRLQVGQQEKLPAGGKDVEPTSVHWLDIESHGVLRLIRPMAG